MFNTSSKASVVGYVFIVQGLCILVAKLSALPVTLVAINLYCCSSH